MNRLKTDETTLTIGQPITDKTIPFIEDGVQEAISNVVKGLLGTYTTNDVIILYGITVTLSTTTISNDTATWTSGAIYYNGEVYTVPAGSVVKTAGQTFVFTNTETYDNTIDPTYFEDNSPHNVHQVRQIQIVAGASGGSGVSNYIADYNGATVKYLYTFLGSVLSVLTNGDLTLSNSYSVAGGGVGGAGIAKYEKDLFGNVRLIGSIASPGTVTSPTFATLPAGYRPAHPKVFSVGSWTSQQNNCVCYIETNGDCRLYDGTGANVSASKTFWLDSVRFNISD
jgi:hypothetical protein